MTADLEHPDGRALQTRFLGALADEIPAVLKSLREDVHPHVPLTGWTTSRDRRYPAIPGGDWRGALSVWQRRWNLVNPWLRAAAVGTLRSWCGLERAGIETTLLTFTDHGSDDTVVGARRFDPDLPLIYPDASLPEQEERLRAAFEEQLASFMEELRADLEADGWEEAPETREGQRTYAVEDCLRALARHQTTDATWRQLAEEMYTSEHRERGIWQADLTSNLRVACGRLRDRLGLTPQSHIDQSDNPVTWASAAT